MSWPKLKTIKAALLGYVREVLRTPADGNVPGLKAGTPHVWAAVGPQGAVAVCDLCATREQIQMVPATQALAFQGWLGKFEKTHAHPPEEAKE